MTRIGTLPAADLATPPSSLSRRTGWWRSADSSTGRRRPPSSRAAGDGSAASAALPTPTHDAAAVARPRAHRALRRRPVRLGSRRHPGRPVDRASAAGCTPSTSRSQTSAPRLSRAMSTSSAGTRAAASRARSSGSEPGDRTTVVARLPVGLRYAGVASHRSGDLRRRGMTPGGPSDAALPRRRPAGTRHADRHACRDPTAHAPLVAAARRSVARGRRRRPADVLRIDPRTGSVTIAAERFPPARERRGRRPSGRADHRPRRRRQRRRLVDCAGGVDAPMSSCPRRCLPTMV